MQSNCIGCGVCQRQHYDKDREAGPDHGSVLWTICLQIEPRRCAEIVKPQEEVAPLLLRSLLGMYSLSRNFLYN